MLKNDIVSIDERINQLNKIEGLVDENYVETIEGFMVEKEIQEFMEHHNSGRCVADE